jgi:hypothetical protein
MGPDLAAGPGPAHRPDLLRKQRPGYKSHRLLRADADALPAGARSPEFQAPGRASGSGGRVARTDRGSLTERSADTTRVADRLPMRRRRRMNIERAG